MTLIYYSLYQLKLHSYRLIHVELRYKRQQAMRDMLLFMCFTLVTLINIALEIKNLHFSF